MAQEKRLIWETPSKKVSYAYNLKKEYLGCLQYENVGRHMHWCWYQIMDIRMSPGCLQEVRDKQKELLKLSRKSPVCLNGLKSVQNDRD